MAQSERTPEPPALQLSDPGMRWRLEGSVLRIHRRVSMRAITGPGAIILGMGTIAFFALRDDDPFVGGVMLVTLIFPVAYLYMRIVQRVEVVVDGAGFRWRQDRPRPFHGEWSRDQVDGIRIVVHPRGRWLQPRQAHVDLRVDGSWTTFVFSGSVRRAERFADALALSTALSPDRVDREG